MELMSNGNISDSNTDHVPLDMSQRIISMEQDNYPAQAVSINHFFLSFKTLNYLLLL